MSAITEIRERYKILPLWGRLLAAAIVGFLPALYIYFDEGAVLDEQVTGLEQQVEEARQKFQEASRKHGNLPKLEEQLHTTQELLAAAEKKLPDKIKIEDILEKVATLARNSSISMTLFDPGDEIRRDVPYPYMELPILIEFVGSFANVATFLDGLTHLDGTMFMRTLELNRAIVNEISKQNRNSNAEISRPNEVTNVDAFNDYQRAILTRANLQIKGRLELAVYRSRTAADGFSAPSVEAPGRQSDQSKKAGGDDTASHGLPPLRLRKAAKL